MFEAIAALFAAGIVAQILFWTVAGVLFPVFWLWMIIDAALRPEADYPSGGNTEKLVWIVAMAFIQVAAIAYFFFVYRTVRRSPAAAATSLPMSSVPGTAA